MIRLLERRFDVELPLADAWRFLARVAEWPRWAAHIRSIDLDPHGEVGARTSGRIRLKNGVTSTFRITEFAPGRNWKWAGPFLWLTIHYDHRFEALAAERTRLTWTVDAEGFGASTLGRLFAAIYARSLDQAIPNLIAAMPRGLGGQSPPNRT